MVIELFEEYVRLERSSAQELQDRINALEAAVSEYAAQDVVDQANNAELQQIKDRIAAEISAIRSVNLTPVSDAMAESVKESDKVDTPASILEDANIGTGEATSDEALEDVPEAITIVVAEAVEAEAAAADADALVADEEE